MTSNKRHVITQSAFIIGKTQHAQECYQESNQTSCNLAFTNSPNLNLLTISFFLFLFAATPSLLFGQQKDVVKSNQQWFQYYNQTKLNNNLTLLYDGSYRWKDRFQKKSQYLIRAAIGYNINSDIQISSGIAHLGFYFSDKLITVEFRPYQEILVKNKFNKIGMNHRYRIEERFFYPVDNGEIQKLGTFNFRFRYAFMFSIPLFKLSKTKTDKAFLLNIGDEIFINAGKEVVNGIFDQNRIIVSPTFKLNESLSLSLTWNSQFASTQSQDIFNYTNVYWFQIKHNLKIGKKQKE
ncbi:MAG: DUF2490 domain-containing protein [Bacteroidales bacterium]